MGSSMMGMASTALPIAAGVAAAGYGANKLLSDRNKWDDANEWEYGVRNGLIAGAGTGAAIGSVVPVVGTAIGGLVGGAIGGLGGLSATQFGGKKHKDQQRRDGLS